MPRKRPRSGYTQRASASTNRTQTAARYSRYSKQPDLLPKPQGALKLGRRNDNPLRHVSEYLRFVRKTKPLETSFRKDRPYHEYLDDYAWYRESRRLEDCERRKARREVIHATGKAGKVGVRYKGRRKPSKDQC